MAAVSDRSPADYHHVVGVALEKTVATRSKYLEITGQPTAFNRNEPAKLEMLSEVAHQILGSGKEHVVSSSSPSMSGSSSSSLESGRANRQVLGELKSEINHTIGLIASKGFRPIAAEGDALYMNLCNAYEGMRGSIREGEVVQAMIRELEGVLQQLEGVMVIHPPWEGSVRLEPFSTKQKVMYPPIPIGEVLATYHTRVHPVLVNLLEVLNRREDMRSMVGVFRVSPLKAELDKLMKELRSGDMRQLLDKNTSIHLLAVALKTTLREQFTSEVVSGPLKRSLFEVWEGTKDLTSEVRVTQMREAIMHSDPATKETLKSIIAFFNGYAQFKDVTKMDAKNLGIVVGPNLFEQAEDPMLAMHEPSNDISGFLIENYHAIFE